jgi:hypothetical protein
LVLVTCLQHGVLKFFTVLAEIPILYVTYEYKIDISIVGRATLKMLRRKSKTQFLKQERNTRIAPQQLMLRTQVFTKNFKSQGTQLQLNKHEIY